MSSNPRRLVALVLILSLVLPTSVASDVIHSATGQVAVHASSPNVLASVKFQGSPNGNGEGELAVDSAPLYSISGRVTDSGGNPVSGVTVTATRILDDYPIILIPGAMASRLEATQPSNAQCLLRLSGTAWLNYSSLRDSVYNIGLLSMLFLNSHGDKPAADPCDSIKALDLMDDAAPTEWFADIYTGFVTTLGDNGYTVMKFPYDWRLDIDENARKLDDFIAANKGSSNKVILIGHSMGGLVARDYVANQTWAGKVAKVITIGTPYLGAPKAAYVMRTGEAELLPWFLRPFLEPNADMVKQIIRNSPGAMELLPSRRYFDYGPYYFTSGLNLDDYVKTANYFVGLDQNGYLLNIADQFHQRLDDFDENYHLEGEYYVLATRHLPTVSAILESTPCSIPFTPCFSRYRAVEYVLGDETVPDVSSHLSVNEGSLRGSATICSFAQGNVDKDHAELLASFFVQEDVLSILKGESPIYCDIDDQTTVQSASSSMPRFREIAVWGDVDVRVEDASGNYMGPNPDGTWTRLLPDVTYDFIDGGIILTLPEDANYEVQIHNRGTTPIEIRGVDFGTTQDDMPYTAQAQAIFENIHVPENENISIAGASAPLAELHAVIGEDTSPQIITPDAILTDPNQVQDFIMPATAISVDGPQNSEGAYIEPVTVSLTAMDDNSGLLKSYYSLDNGQNWQEYVTPVQVAQGQASSVQAYSVDRAGNQEWPYIAQPITFADELTDTPTETPTSTATSIPTNTPTPTATATSMPSTTPTPTATTSVPTPEATSSPVPTYPSVDTTKSYLYLPVAIRENQQVAPVTTEQNVYESISAESDFYVTSTDADGRYTFDALVPGHYTVTAIYLGASLTPTEHVVTLPPSAINIDFIATHQNSPPYAPADPLPSDGAGNQSLDVQLAWSSGDPDGDAVSHTVRFGTTNPPPEVATNHTGTTYNLGSVTADTTYYWQIVAKDAFGLTTIGPVWRFSTLVPSPSNVTEILIPSGTFQMGCDSSNDPGCQANEIPLHTVFLDDFYIDKYEVTNARYKACVDAGVCILPDFGEGSISRTSYYGNPAYDGYPVIGVDWFQATTFCTWEGKRLPTEAEWEKAARGSNDTRIYPWGNQTPNCTLANFHGGNPGNCVGDTAAVGSYPAGASPYGVMEMAGNVVEWVNDWYASDYYSTSPLNNPQGPTSGEYRLLRGGSWGDYDRGYAHNLRAAYRDGLDPEYGDHLGLGFRCARSAHALYATLNIEKLGTGTGTVISQPSGINCGSDCGETYPQGTTVVLTATATSGSTFVGWSGACIGSSPECSLLIDGSKIVTAMFGLQSPPPVVDEILIPSGAFQMGCDSSSDFECKSDELPLHAVVLDEFYIDKYEVTNVQYKACMDAGICTAPFNHSSYTRAEYFDNPDYADYPVILVDWFQATTFCTWGGKRLPTEAEWEKAARGSADTRSYPWGSQTPDCTLARSWIGCETHMGDTSQVGSYPDGSSPYGVMDMAGNVREWVNDWYGSNYYCAGPAADTAVVDDNLWEVCEAGASPYMSLWNSPQGPANGSYRILRGGSWFSGHLADDTLKVVQRDYWAVPSGKFQDLGFRCARTP